MEQQQQQTTTSPILVDTSQNATAAVVNKSTTESPSIKNNYLTKKLFPEPVNSDVEEMELSNFSKSMWPQIRAPDPLEEHTASQSAGKCFSMTRFIYLP